MRRLHLGCLLFFFSVSTVAQNQSCDVDVPVNVVMPDAALLRNIPQEGFIAHRGKDVLAIRSVDADTTPRRIVLVVENGKNVDAAARKLEANILSAVVTNGRPVDSFAFLTAIGPRMDVRFGAPRETLLSAIGEASLPIKAKDQSKSVLDAVLEASAWLQPPQPGDSIILLTMGLKPDEPSYGRVGNVLTSAGIRLFAFQLGRFYAGTYLTGVAPAATPGGMLLPTATVVPKSETIFNLAVETGGFSLLENTEGGPQRKYQLTDERLQSVTQLGGQLYKGITDYYRIRIVSPTEGFAIDLSDSVHKRFPKAQMAYPRKLPGCPRAKP
jgi:hypothetical protein